MRSPSNLRVLGRARQLALVTYEVTGGFPYEERFGFQSQMRRAAVSVGANIVEGHGRGTQGDFERHLRIASGSLAELQFLTGLASDIELLTKDQAGRIVNQTTIVGRMLVALTQRVRQSRETPGPPT